MVLFIFHKENFIKLVTNFKDHYNLPKNSTTVYVGFIEKKMYPKSNKLVSEIAYVNEFGTEKSPPRPFMRRTLKVNKSKWLNFYKKSIKNKNIFEVLGKLAVKDMKDEIKKQGFAPLAISTVKKKKSEVQLIDTGRMIDSISYKVMKK